MFFWGGESINSDLPDRLIIKSQVGGMFFCFKIEVLGLSLPGIGWFHQVFFGVKNINYTPVI